VSAFKNKEYSLLVSKLEDLPDILVAFVSGQPLLLMCP